MSYTGFCGQAHVQTFQMLFYIILKDILVNKAKKIVCILQVILETILCNITIKIHMNNFYMTKTYRALILCTV